jgi:hypothetical protein
MLLTGNLFDGFLKYDVHSASRNIEGWIIEKVTKLFPLCFCQNALKEF